MHFQSSRTLLWKYLCHILFRNIFTDHSLQTSYLQTKIFNFKAIFLNKLEKIQVLFSYLQIKCSPQCAIASDIYYRLFCNASAFEKKIRKTFLVYLVLQSFDLNAKELIRIQQKCNVHICASILFSEFIA